MGWAIAFGASAIADFLARPPEDFKLLYNASMMYKP